MSPFNFDNLYVNSHRRTTHYLNRKDFITYVGTYIVSDFLLFCYFGNKRLLPAKAAKGSDQLYLGACIYVYYNNTGAPGKKLMHTWPRQWATWTIKIFSRIPGIIWRRWRFALSQLLRLFFTGWYYSGMTAFFVLILESVLLFLSRLCWWCCCYCWIPLPKKKH